MKKVIICFLILFSVFFAFGCGYVDPTKTPTSDPGNTTFDIDGRLVTLVDGISIETQDDSSSFVSTSLFEIGAEVDVDGDGRADKVVLLTQNLGGSGTFYYVAVALDTPEGHIGSNSILLGDRIAPQSIHVTNGIIEVNYADRKAGESFVVPPSVGFTKYLRYSNHQLEQVVQPL